MKITFIFDKTQWGSEAQKVKAVCDFFAPAVSIEPTIIHSSFDTIPFVSVGATGGITNTVGTTTTVNPGWYDKNVTPLSPHADIIVFYLVPETLNRTSIAIEQGKISGVVQCCIFGIRETDDAYINGIDEGSSFVLFACHEISHALYLLQGKKDNTHAYFYTGQPKKVLDELKTVSNILYDTSKGLLHQHLTLNPNVPNDVGCAEAVSYVLKKVGVLVPDKGIAGTASLLHWLQTNPLFVQVPSYEVGAIILSATGTGNGKINGHTGICANYGILSNDSATGLFLELWDIAKWTKYYEVYGGMKTYYFKYLG